MDGLRETFSQELKKLEGHIIEMGRIVKQMLSGSVDGFRRRDEKKLDAVVALDDRVDRYNLDIETRCLELIALQQPMARDLRTIASIMRMITDIERMGDYSVDVAKFMKRMLKEEVLPISERVYGIEKSVEKMLDEMLDAFSRRDLDLISQIVKDDDIVDASFRSLFDEVLSAINSNPQSAKPAIHLLMIARYFERIGDHITNVGERIYYMETGELKELHV